MDHPHVIFGGNNPAGGSDFLRQSVELAVRNDLYYEFEGGLGDVIMQASRTGTFSRLDQLTDSDTAVITLICHNPYAYELFAFHPKRSRILILSLGHFDGRRELHIRKRHGIPSQPIYREALSTVEWNKWKPYVSEEDALYLSSLPERIVAFAPTASSGPRDTRSVPKAIIDELTNATLERGLVPVFIGRRYKQSIHENPLSIGPHSELEPPDLPGVLSSLDKLSVAGSVELIRRASLAVVCDSAMLHAAWGLRKPTYFLCPDHRMEADGYRYGINYPENRNTSFSQYSKDSFLTFLALNQEPCKRLRAHE
jgi:hypothetical protein